MMFLWALTIISVLAMVPLQSLDLPRKSCSGYCSGSYKTGAKCVNGFCECSKPGYNKYTCLPEVGNCRVIPNNPDAVAAATLKSVTQTVRSCLNTVDVHRYQVHVLGVYEGNVHTRPPTAGTTHVYVEGVGEKPVVLALSSYEPVRWVIHAGSDIQLHAVLMFSYYNTISSVDLSHVVNSTSVLVEKRRRSSAIGDDSGGGNTVGLIKLLNARWGPIKSFSGCYKADHWTLTVSKPKATALEQPTSTSTPVESCLESKDCWVKYNFLFEDNWNDCHGDQYVKKTKYQVGKYVGVVLCSANKYKLFLSDSLTGRFLNIADGSGHGQDHCEFIGRTTDAKSIDNDFWNSPATTGYSRSFRGKTPTIGRIGGGTGSTWSGQYYYKWIKCGVSIPGDSRVVTWTGSEDKTPQPPTGEPEPTLKPDKTIEPPTGESEPEPTLKPDKTPQPPTGEPEPEPNLKPVLPRKSCSSYCSGSYKTGAKCVNGFCECSQPGYNKYTCLH
ncbi:uncharacterized protein LOC121374683 [Gigantopelta aegis]|uniref:uncharacterized protein LOC121374683 n=1 Tax=Gigantopelta aegis TaxID=1735272 RepID=UPI001B88E5FA|nr:uncharacterized protein LOC121374683 [Gigantopelta aegis]